MVDYNLDTMQYINTINKNKGYELIQDNLSMVEQQLLAEQPGQHSLLTEATFQLLQAGGKRIRAAICLLSAGIFGADLDRSYSLAAGVEMLHTATLIHDDLIDGAMLRRGKPTLNAGSNANFTVLIGDYFFARAANLVSKTDNLDIMNQFADTLMTILNGEINQQYSLWQVDHQEYYDRIYAKTGAMFVLAAKSAAALGGADQKDLLAMEKYGYYSGIAFQIVDDVFDFTNKQTQLGKPVGNDLRQGLITLPTLLYSERYPNDPNLKLLLEVQDGNHPAAAKLISSILDSGVINDAINKAKDLVSQGQHALKAVPYSRYVEALASLTETIVERKV